MRLFVSLGLVLLGVPPLSAQPGPGTNRGPYDLPIQEHVFPNGLRLLVLERAGDPRVAAKIFTDFGAYSETPGDLGAAHFLEHLMFKGTPTLGTTNWSAEAALRDSLLDAEAQLIAELNRARNALRERGVFHDYSHATSTLRADSLRETIARLDAAIGAYRDNGAMMRWYQAFGGANLTATTEQEYMKFDINLPRAHVDVFLRVEADRMRNSVFREFDAERMILVEQRLGDLNRPTTPYYEQMNAAAGVIHPVFWPEGFYPTDFEQYTRAYQRRLYDRYFQPNNTTVVLVGGVRFPDMVQLVDRFFSWMPRAPEPERVKAIEPVPAAERRVIYRSDDLSPRVEARFLIPGVGHPDRPAFDVLAEVARRRLADAFRASDLAVRIGVNTRVVHTERFGVPSTINFEVAVGSEADLAAAESVLLATLDGLGTTPADSATVALSTKVLRVAWHRLALDADRLAFEIGHFQTMDSWRALRPYLEARDATTADHVMQLATRYFIPDNRTIGVVRPKTARPPNTSDAPGGRQ